jgi:hypothetical protein
MSSKHFLFTLAIVFVFSCTKSVTEDSSIINEPEQPADEDTIAYPYSMKINGIWPKGPGADIFKWQGDIGFELRLQFCI